MAEVLVLAEHTADGEVKKVTLRAADRGAAARVAVGGVDGPGRGGRAGTARGVRRGRRSTWPTSADFAEYPVAPAAELLAQLAGSVSPAAVLVAGTTEGKEIAGRLAVKTGLGRADRRGQRDGRG